MRAYHEEPLIGGAVGLAIGLALGASLPATETEDRYVGPLRDDMVDRGRAAAREGMDKGREVAGAAYEAARHEAKEKAEETGSKRSDASSAAGGKSGGGAVRSRRQSRTRSDRPLRPVGRPTEISPAGTGAGRRVSLAAPGSGGRCRPD